MPKDTIESLIAEVDQAETGLMQAYLGLLNECDRIINGEVRCQK